MAAFDPLVSQYLSGPAGLNNSGIDPRVLRYLANKDPNALPTDQPPVIPDIAKAYVNDPRTQLAINAIKTGTSTDPVARGKYGIADGIARALTATLGGYVNKQQEAKYAQQQQGLIESRRTNNQDPLTGTAVNTAPTTTTPDTTSSSLPAVGGTMPVAGGPSGMSSVPPPASAGTPPPDPTTLSLTSGASPITSALASQIAGATGVPAPPPATPAPGMAAGIPQGPIPTGPAPPPPAPPVPTGLSPQPGGPPVQVAPIGGGSSQSTGPFSQGSGTSAPTVPVSPSTTTSDVPTSPTTPAAAIAAQAGTTTPGVKAAAAAASSGGKYAVPQVAVPDMPKELDNLVEPQAPTAPAAKVSTLLQTARQMIQTGNPYDSDRAQTMLSEGLKEQDTLNQAAQDFANEVTMKQYGSKLDLYARFKGAKLEEALKERSDALEANYAAARQSITNQLEWDKAKAQNATTLQAAGMQVGGELAKTRMTIQGEKDIEQMKAQIARQQFLQTAANKVSPAAQQSNQIAQQGLYYLQQYQNELNKKQYHPGGGVGSFIQGVINPFDPERGTISGLSNNLALIQQQFAKGGRGSNLQLRTIQASKPGLDVSPAVQQQRVNDLRNAYLKSIEYNNAYVDSVSRGIAPADFERDFGQYERETINTPPDKFISYPQWQAQKAAGAATPTAQGKTGNPLVDKYL